MRKAAVGRLNGATVKVIEPTVTLEQLGPKAAKAHRWADVASPLQSGCHWEFTLCSSRGDTAEEEEEEEDEEDNETASLEGQRLKEYKELASELLPALRNRCHLHHLTFSKSNTTVVLTRVQSGTGEVLETVGGATFRLFQVSKQASMARRRCNWRLICRPSLSVPVEFRCLRERSSNTHSMYLPPLSGCRSRTQTRSSWTC
eukprot:SAG22_NODE_1044_length_5882_cov_3.015390_2_plen_202_part_00